MSYLQGSGINMNWVSTRALYGNYKNRKIFPLLDDNPVRYYFNGIKCSICKKEIDYTETNQLWISLLIGTDVLPLLVNLCSKECESKLPKPPKNYIQYPHKGGILVYPKFKSDPVHKLEITDINKPVNKEKNTNSQKNLRLLKVIKKIWEK